MNKLQNSVILSDFKYKQIRNIRFVGNFILNIRGNFFSWWLYYGDVICSYNTERLCIILPTSSLSYISQAI